MPELSIESKMIYASVQNNLLIRPPLLLYLNSNSHSHIKHKSILQNWSSMAHPRDVCQQCVFTIGLHASNAKFCAKCFCYVCDVPAGECKEWGNGASRTNHCNAHSKSITYRTLKETQRKANRIANNASGSGTAPTAAAAATATIHRYSSPPTGSAPRSAAAAAAAPRGRQKTTVVIRGSGAALTASAARRPAAPIADPMDLLRTAPTQVANPLPNPLPSSPLESVDEGDMSEDCSEDYGCPCPNCRGGRGRRFGFGYGYSSEEEDPYADAYASLVPFRPEVPKECNHTEKPDPTEEAGLMELADITFGCQATGSNTIPGLIKRLAPNGFFEARVTPGTLPSFGDRYVYIV